MNDDATQARAPLGTLAWARARGGALQPAERALLVAHGVGAVLAQETGRLAARLGLGPAAASPERLSDELRAPGSALAERADALRTEVCQPWLAQHCYRTYAWACILATHGDLRPDRELLYLASLFHDLGITEAYLAAEGECFAYRGARAARDFLREQGLDEARAAIVAEAICLHLDVRVGLEHGAEAHLLRAATALDVVGQGAHRIAAPTRAQVVALHPRHDMKRHVAAAITRLAKRGPQTRIGFLCQHLGMLERVRRAPFEG